MPTTLRRIVMVLLALIVLAGVVYAFVPEPIPVDLAVVARGPLQVTVDEEGKTRIKERYVISAPLAGRLRRITLDPGDTVEASTTVLTIIEPTDPNLLDAPARSEAEARVRASEAAVLQTGANLERVRAALEHAEDEQRRMEDAFEQGAANTREYNDKTLIRRMVAEQHRAAEFARDIANFELELARSTLLHTNPDADAAETGVQFKIRSPIDGRVLRVLRESVAVVTPGTSLLEIGDPTDLELVIDVLSTDAVRVSPGDDVIIDHWGGDEPLTATVRLIEPSAFTKVSALGVEEQRVNVIADFISPIEDRPTLGDGFRVEAAIVLWSDASVTRIPRSALFRHDGAWSVFVVENGRAVRRAVDLGRQNGLAAQVLARLEPGETVIVHPGDQVKDGVRVEVRAGE